MFLPMIISLFDSCFFAQWSCCDQACLAAPNYGLTKNTKFSLFVFVDMGVWNSSWVATPASDFSRVFIIGRCFSTYNIYKIVTQSLLRVVITARSTKKARMIEAEYIVYDKYPIRGRNVTPLFHRHTIRNYMNRGTNNKLQEQNIKYVTRSMGWFTVPIETIGSLTKLIL